MSSADGGSSGIVMLASDCDTTRAVYHALRRDLGSITVIVEERLPRRVIFFRRWRRLGPLTAVGQAAFMVLLAPILARRARSRVATIVSTCGLDLSPLPADVIRVASINSPEAREAIRRANPRVVVVNGTRIISADVLGSVSAPVLNIHLGITPLYRGSHGGYWARAEGRDDLVGATLHLVDEGIDTGEIVAQRTVAVTSRDSFASYPFLQLCAIIPALIETIRVVLSGSPIARSRRDDLPSRLRHHPTLSSYLKTWWRTGAR